MFTPYDWVLLVSLIVGDQVHVEKVADYQTKEECNDGARKVLSESYQKLRPMMYSQIVLVCTHIGEKVKT